MKDESVSSDHSCPLKGRWLLAEHERLLVLVCLDPTHGVAIPEGSWPGLLLARCPLLVNRYLDLHPRQPVVLDRCRAALHCCRRPLAELEQRIRLDVRSPPTLCESDFATGLRDGDTGLAHHLNDGLQKACRQFAELRDHKVTLQDLARYFAVSPRQLNRWFRAAAGTSAMRAYRAQCLRQAYDRIWASSCSIEAIAEDLNYHDRSSFARAFRRTFGLYPGRLRRISRESGS